MPSPAGVNVICDSLLVIPDSLSTLRVIAVIVILMNRGDLRRDVNNVGPSITCMPDEPVVPPNPADQQRGHFVVKTVRKQKVVDRIAWLLNPRAVGDPSELRFRGWREFAIRFSDGRIPPAS